MTDKIYNEIYDEIVSTLQIAIREKRSYALQTAMESNNQSVKLAESLVENAKADGLQEAIHMIMNIVNIVHRTK